jgi:hypothetical protein
MLREEPSELTEYSALGFPVDNTDGMPEGTQAALEAGQGPVSVSDGSRDPSHGNSSSESTPPAFNVLPPPGDGEGEDEDGLLGATASKMDEFLEAATRRASVALGQVEQDACWIATDTLVQAVFTVRRGAWRGRGGVGG